MQIVYATRKPENIEGREFRNPRFFTAPEQGATKVYIDGDWPTVSEAYTKAKVPVEPIANMKALPGKTNAKTRKTKAAAKAPSTAEAAKPAVAPDEDASSA